MFIPYHVDVPMERMPIANWVIIGVTTIAFFVFAADTADPVFLESSSVRWGLHLLMHGDFVHLFGNMLFLFLFGNAICAKAGNVLFPVLYLLLGWIAIAVHILVDGRPAIGASGAINGIVGMY